MTHLFAPQSPTVWSSELGEFINEDHRRFAEILHDLKPTYSLQYIPKAQRESVEDRANPWRIIDSPPGVSPYLVRTMTEVEMNNPQEILAWLFAGDIVRHGTDAVLRQIEAKENAARLMELKRQEDELEDILEHTAFLASGGRNRLHTIRTGKGEKVER